MKVGCNMNEILQFILELKKIKYAIHPNMSLQEQVILKEEIDRVIQTYELVAEDYEDWGDKQAINYVTT